MQRQFQLFNTDTEHKDAVIALFEDYRLQGRDIHVEITKDTRGSGGGKNAMEKDVGAKVQAVEILIEAFLKVKAKAEATEMAVNHHFQEKEDVGTGVKT